MAVIIGIGSDNITSTNSGGLTDSTTFFSNGRGHMPRNGSNSFGFNPPLGAHQKSANNNNTLFVTTIIGKVMLELLVTN
ncbi:hypothetical protein H5410_004544 [Solanum commersonii]|uniref:Uncharacterized protein n=1 Tax=Solanum commersonii TaxID=4109 RepID=A0A9J6B8A7_SOLCO|nr:hypothetical protein H5410_004544 [Solanum commersonii]